MDTYDVPLPKPGEPVIVVADFMSSKINQVMPIPTGSDMYSGSEHTRVIFSVFRAVDEDGAGREVLVIMDDSSPEGHEDRSWLVIPSDLWAQTEYGKYLVRSFPTLEEAIACLGEDKVALQRLDDVNGWHCTVAHRSIGLWSDFRRLLRTPTFVEVLQIPDGMPALVDTDTLEGYYPGLAKDLPDLDYLSCSLIFTSAAEIFMIYITQDGYEPEQGLMIFTRLFTYNEARNVVEVPDDD